ncbi:hemin-binding protein [Opitutaceae bacterium TAV5]|nr:hemin-binding protein [Opitutaceae bacterium TAV5]
MTPADAGPRIHVSEIRFVGNTLYDQQTLAALVASDLNRELTFQQLLATATRVENYYHQKGYQLVRVVIPRQDVRDGGPIEFRVLEGWLGQIHVTGNRRYSTRRVLDTLAHTTAIGQPFTIPEVERPLVFLNERSGLTASSTLKPGAETGSTDIEIEIKEDRRISGSIEANNFGSDDSGEYRIIPAFSLPNFTGAGDVFSAFGVFSPDQTDVWFYQVDYTRPLGTNGTSGHLYFGQGNNEAGNEYEILDIKGDNISWGAGLSHHIIWSARSSLNLQGWFEWQDMEQRMLGGITSDDSIRKLRFGADYDRKDNSGRTFLSLHIHQGLGHILGGMKDNYTLSSRAYAGADNSFTKFVLSLMRVQSFHPRLYALLNFTGQYSLDPLVSGEQIYIGGANTVRGQPQSHYSGDDGFVINAEVRFSILPDNARWQLAGFFDHGETHLQRPIIGQQKWRSLSGAGLGFRAELFKNLDARFDVGFPVGAQRGDDCYFYGQVRFSF